MKMQIGKYLLKRLKDYNITDIFGVPGDYNLGLLDILSNDKELNWVGNCNELNAAYAADGYARVKGIGALITTMGVGEISALNGIAGSFAEDVPVVQITGIAKMADIENKAVIHHTLGDGNFNHFKKIYAEVSAYQTILTPTNAQSEIDKALSQAYLYKKPVYIGIPEDIVTTEIEVVNPIEPSKIFTNQKTLDTFIKDVQQIIKNTSEHLLVFGHYIQRYNLQKLSHKIIAKAQIPFFTSNLGRNVIGDDISYAQGIYNNQNPICKQADTVIALGTKPSESFDLKAKNIIEINPSYCKINNKTYENIYIKDAMEQLLSADIKLHSSIPKSTKELPDFDESKLSNNSLTFKDYQQIIEHNINGNFNLIVEQGTSYFLSARLMLSDNVRFIGQSLWSSIGYTAAASLGTCIANNDKRTVLLIGDGSIQMTLQCISTMLREEVCPIIIMNNNSGYTIERYVAGAHKKYNDIQNWNYPDIIEAFSSSSEKPLILKVKTSHELNLAFKKALANPHKLVFIEMITDRFNVPEDLKTYAKINARQDRYNEGINNQDLPRGILNN